LTRPRVRLDENGWVPSADSAPREPIEHRLPSETTLKRLYATAFGCCKPGCGQRLFRVNEATGAWLLNSRVAHIHARRERGPRWDPQMSEADNQGYENLVLLCIQHASEIDDTPEHYPADLLRSWKHAESDSYERHQRSWTLSEGQVAEVIAVSFDPQPLLEQIAATLPFSTRMRSREDALARVAARARAKRSVRLRALLPLDRVEDVVAWMADHSDPVVQVPKGHLCVLVAPMGAGKSEQALRWLEEALRTAWEDTEAEIPVWLDARQINGDLESVITAAVGADPVRPCRIVIDDLDSLGSKEADYLLNDARELVQVWPRISVLATSRPGLSVSDQELLRVDPWPAERGVDLLRLLVGERIPWGFWTHETMELLQSPLSALALASRLNAGGDAKVSRLELLSDLAGNIIRWRHSAHATEETWQDLARLAACVLEGSGRVRAASFGTEPRVRNLAATDLVINDGGFLTFTLPLFEQHFGAQAIAAGVVTLESAASPAAFPRWRYAIAFAVSTSKAPVQEQLMIRLARVNPAAALWVLREVAPGDAHTGRLKDLTDTAIAALISLRSGAGERSAGETPEPSPAILAAGWLREAEQALLDGLGPLAGSLASYQEGRLVQWGAWLESPYLTVAEARKTAPPPEVVQLDSIHPEVTVASGWQRWTLYGFPDAELGRWLWTQSRLQKRLLRILRQRTLPVPTTSRLARERLWFLSQFVMKLGTIHRPKVIEVAALRAKVSELMVRVDNSVNSSWQNAGTTIQSADVRWLETQLELEAGELLEPPWPTPDRPYAARKWMWENYSPELTLTIATDILRDALVGYRELVELNFPNFGAALGLYSLLPVRIEGIVARFEGDAQRSQVETIVELIQDPSLSARTMPPVSLQLVTAREDESLYQFAQARGRARPSTFGPRTVEELPLGLHVARPATNVAYHWLARDLKAVGWLTDDVHYHD
jgi:hypothetical protein